MNSNHNLHPLPQSRVSTTTYSRPEERIVANPPGYHAEVVGQGIAGPISVMKQNYPQGVASQLPPAPSLATHTFSVQSTRDCSIPLRPPVPHHQPYLPTSRTVHPLNHSEENKPVLFPLAPTRK